MKLPKHAKRRRTVVAAATATLVPAAALIASMAAASPAASPGGARVAISQGIGAAALHGASVFGTTPPGTPETVSFVLRARDQDQLVTRCTRGGSRAAARRSAS